MSGDEVQGQMAQRLKRARRALGKTGVEIARELGVDKSIYSRYENGKLKIAPIHLEALDRKFGISPDYLVLDRRGSCGSDVRDALAKLDATRR